jgi:methylamine utilization protein MauE
MTFLLPGFWVACALLIIAGAAKLRSPAAAVGALRTAGLRTPAVGVRLLGAAEIAIGAFAVARPSVASAATVAVLYAGFALFVLRLLHSRDPAPCGCFGAAGPEVSRMHPGLNVAACAVATASALAPPPGIGWVLRQDPLLALSLAVGMAGAAFAAFLAFTALPAAWRAYEAVRP